MSTEPSATTPSHWLLVDVSYVIFYRYHATRAWFKRAHAARPDPTCDGDGEDGDDTRDECRLQFRTMLLKRLRDTVYELQAMHPAECTVLCCDGTDNWRKTVDDRYKRNRQCAPFLRTMFVACLDVLRSMCTDAARGMQMLEHPQLEADDIVHFIARARCPRTTASPATVSAATVTIVASDRDYVPLLRHPAVSLVDIKGKSVRCPPSIPLELFLHVKILAGDKSDNIPPIFARCGAVTALRLAQDPSLLHERLASSEEAQQQYERNVLLIDTEKALQAYPQYDAWLTQQYYALSHE